MGAPWEKDYDAMPGQHPTSWPRRFDVSRWIVMLADSDDELVGGAVIVPDGLTARDCAGRYQSPRFSPRR